MFGNLITHFKHAIKPKTFVYALGAVGAGAALIASPYSAFETAVIGGAGLMMGYMFYDLATKHETHTRIDELSRQTTAQMNQLNNPIGQPLLATARQNGLKIAPEARNISTSTVNVLNKLGHGVGAILVVAGTGLQAAGVHIEHSSSSPTPSPMPTSTNTSTPEASGNKILEITGTGIAATGLAISLVTHLGTAPILRRRCAELQEIHTNLTEIIRKHDVNQALENAERAVTEAHAIDIRPQTQAFKLN